jgi:phosphoserine phosphatase
MDKKKNEIKVVILDLDQTLTVDMASWLQFTSLLGTDSMIHTNIYNKFKDGEISYTKAKKQLIDLWKCVHKLDKDSIREIFKKIEFREGAFEAVEYLKKKYKLCLISGAIDVFVDVIAEKLGIYDKYASTKFIFNDKNILKDFKYKLSRGEEKVGFLHDFCTKYNINPLNCAAIGDGNSDVPIFNEVGCPILFIAKETTENLKRTFKVQIRRWNEIYKYL